MLNTIVDNVDWTDKQKKELIAILGKLMSECSEECWSAAWLLGTEKQLPSLVDQVLDTRESATWGHGMIDYETALSLRGLKNILGNWVVYNFESDSYSLNSPLL